MTRRANAAEIDAGLSNLSRLPIEQVAEKIIADCDGDPGAAVTELIAIVGALIEENKALREAASPGFARRGSRGQKG
jgi:hypothetical protein